MGQYFIYKCSKCKYSVSTSGGHDVGMIAVTDIYICQSCKKIVDVVVGYQMKTYTKEQILIKKQNRKLKFELNFHKCPICKSDKDLMKWKVSKRPCPKCDGKMELDTNEQGMLWD